MERIKDIIIRGEENIRSAQVEKLLCYYPRVTDAVVIGMPDKELDEKVCAYVRPAAGAKIDSEEIKALWKTREPQNCWFLKDLSLLGTSP